MRPRLPRRVMHGVIVLVIGSDRGSSDACDRGVIVASPRDLVEGEEVSVIMPADLLLT